MAFKFVPPSTRFSLPMVCALPILLLAMAAFSGDAEAQQYRQGMPEVLTPEQPGPSLNATATKSFEHHYKLKGRPRVMLYWNRALSDEVASDWEKWSRTQTRTNENESESVENLDYGGHLKERQLSREATTTTSSGSHLLKGAERGGLEEAGDWRLRSAMSQSLIEAGIRLVDRTTALRIQNQGKPLAKETDMQALEIRTLLGKAEILLEALMTPQSGSPTGWLFNVSAKEVKTGRIIGSIATYATPDAPSLPKYQATKKGFEVVTPVITVDQVGRQLGLETVQMLTGSL